MDLPGLVGALEPRLGPLREGPEPLTGGITNHNFRARFGDDEVVLRVAGADTDLLGIDRGAERQATEAAAALGIAAPVLAFLPEASCLVTRWVAGTPLDPAGVRARLVPVARALRAFHDGAPPLPVDFDVPRLARDYLTVARGHGSAPPPGAHDAVAVADRVVAAIAAAGRREHAPVPCHDDLLPANLIADGDRIWIVDWEYAGMGDRFFDLGNLAVNNDLTREQEAALLEAYFESPATPRQLAVLRLMRAVSDVREALWGVVQGALSDVRFDFDGYAAQHLVRLARTTDDPDFERWLELAATRELPDAARIVIIGGGVGGTSIAYHLAQLGERDVVLVDRAELTSGSTFHSAGLVGQLRSSVSLTRMMMASVELYRSLDCGWVECGGLRLACTPEREQEVHRQVAWARTFGLPLELLSPAEARERFPLMVTDGVRVASYLPTDGYLDPSMLTYALAAGAREGGVRIFTHTRVTGIDVREGRVQAVDTERGRIGCELVVDAGGMYAAEIARMAGVRVPIVPMAHEYLVTQPFRDRGDGHLPTLRDPDNLIYFREEGGGLVMGGYERACAPWSLDEQLVDRIPPDFNGILLEEDWPRFEEIAEASKRRVPLMEDVAVTRLINGPEAFTPDNEFCLGEAPEVAGFFVAAGFCAHGLAGAGGVGQVMAEWLVSGEPQLDVSAMDLRRFGPQYRSPRYTLARTKEVYETYYDIHYPGAERHAGRPLRVSSAYPWHGAHGAVFGEKAGWERVNWYAANEAAGDASLRPRGWAGRHWSPAIGAEALATRTAAGLFDESSFAKLEVHGPGAAAFLRWICAGDVARAVGRVTYTQLLNSRGGIEADVTVTRLGEDAFLVVTGTASGGRDLAWLRRWLPTDGSVTLHDVTSQWATFALWGPRAADVLAPLTPDALDFAFLTMRELVVADVPVRALRVTFVGEAGWELSCPAEYGAALWRALWEAGAPRGLVAGGYRAIDALRLEKGYRVWGTDVTPDTTPLEAGLGFAVRAGGGFVGADALAARRVDRALACVVLEDPRAVALGNEPVRVGDAVVGRVTSGGYGYAVERSIAYAYVPLACAEPGTAVAVDVFGTWVDGTVVATPLYDPAGDRVRTTGPPGIL